MNKKIILLVFIVTCIAFRANAQHTKNRPNVKDSLQKGFIVSLGLGYFYPEADYKKRFGNEKAVFFEVAYKSKSNYYLGMQGSYFYGQTVKEPALFSHISTSDGRIISPDGHFAEIRLYGRAYYIGLQGSKTLSFIKYNKNSGPSISVGTGYFQHKIKILGDKTNQLSEAYKKGYDRLSTGLAISQSIGYLFLGNNRMLNFKISIECIEAFTKGRRTINFDTGLADNKSRLDMLIGLKAQWILPIYSRPKVGTYTF